MRGASGLFVCLFSASILLAQRDRIPARIDDTRRMILRGTAHPLALPQVDQGAVEPDFAMPGLILHLSQSDEQQNSLRQFLDQLQDPSSPNFHPFLTPEEYADRFGVSPSDITKTRCWLESQGFTVAEIARGRT